MGAVRVCWAWVPPLEDDDGQDKYLYAPVAQLVLRHVLHCALYHSMRRVLRVLILYVSPKANLAPPTPKRAKDMRKIFE